jgi:hypothetical protein
MPLNRDSAPTYLIMGDEASLRIGDEASLRIGDEASCGVTGVNPAADPPPVHADRPNIEAPKTRTEINRRMLVLLKDRDGTCPKVRGTGPTGLYPKTGYSASQGPRIRALPGAR